MQETDVKQAEILYFDFRFRFLILDFHTDDHEARNNI
jgi:hypothetical protein